MITTCSEHDFSKVSRVEAYPLGVLHRSLQFADPVYTSRTAYAFADVVPNDVVPLNIPFVRESVKLTDKFSRSVAHITHEVTFDFSVRVDDEEIVDMLHTLLRTPHELLIHYFGGAARAVRTDEFAYSFQYDSENGTTHCSMQLCNGHGFILLT